MTTLRDQWTTLYTTGRVRWMPGMLTDRGRIVRLQGPQFCEVYSADALACGLRINEPAASLVPDFTDPATIGCLLHQAREAWDSPRLQTSPMLQPAPLEWICYPNACEDDGRRYIAATEPAAIIAAIAAAPPKVTE
jgi:hypothetical protein